MEWGGEGAEINYQQESSFRPLYNVPGREFFDFVLPAQDSLSLEVIKS
jgi:hypothetical protein